MEKALADLNDGLAAYYPFNGNSNDESGNGNNGIVYGANLTDGILGNVNSAYEFDGIDDYIDLGNDDSINLNGDFTLSVWAKVDEPPGGVYPVQAFIGKMGPSGAGQDNQFLIEISDSRGLSGMTFEYNSIGRITVNDFTWPANIWAHVVLTYEATTTAARFYFQGELLKEEIFNNSPFTCDIPVALGATPSDSGKRYLMGCLDEVRIYNRTLSESEIQELYENNADIDEDGINNKEDNCPEISNPGQEDQDGDGIGDICDNCQDVYNSDQADTYGDEYGDACEELYECQAEKASLETDLTECQSDLSNCQIDLEEANATIALQAASLAECSLGIEEIKRLLETPVGQRSSEWICQESEESLCAALNAIIEILLLPPGKAISNNTPHGKRNSN